MSYYCIKAIAPDRAEIRIDGIIGDGWFDENPVTAKSFAKELKAAGKVKNLDIYINSPGGSVFDGSAIYSQIKRHAAKKTVYIDGLAASIASVIAMAGDEIVMPENALMMIHRASSGVWGHADDLRKGADVLEKTESTLIAAYQTKTGRDAGELAELMADETWMTAQEAVNLGFADRIAAPITITACADAEALRHFKTPPPMPMISPLRQESVMTDDVLSLPVAESAPPPEAPAPDPQPEAPAPEVVDPVAFRAAILQAETDRRAAIRALVAPALLSRPPVRACLEACLDDSAVSADAASRRLLAVLGQYAEPLAASPDLPTAHLPLADRCAAEWAQQPELRAEFGTLTAYTAFARATADGRIKQLVRGKAA